MPEPKTQPSLPALFVQRLERLMPADRLQSWHEAFGAPPSAAFRVNTLRATAEEAIAGLHAAGVTAQRLGWPEEAWVAPPEQRRALSDTAAAADGGIYIQNPSSMVPVPVLDPRPGEEILDLAAAPGGKTAQLAARMANEGRIAAVESVKTRFHRMRRNLERCGVTIADTYLADGAGVGRKVPERFDRVLLDAPCTSEGRFRAADPASYRYWSPKKIREMARKQKRLALSAVQALKPGGVLVYCTCTLAPEENEAIVDDLLNRYGGALEVEELDTPTALTVPARIEWDGRDYAPAVARCVRLLPDALREGFFVAKLRKRASTVD